MNLLEGVIGRIAALILARLDRERLARVVDRVLAAAADRLPADQALRLLFDLDARLYGLQGELSVRHGNGLHSKHRHTRYHDFFSSRIVAGERVLDVGCGIGAVAHAVAAVSGAEVLGIDLEPANIAKARERFSHPRVSYLVGDALTEIPAGAFDVVILSNVLEHLPEREQFLARLREQVAAKRVLIRVPLFERDWRVPLKRELEMEWRLDPTHETEYTLESFAAEIGAAGFEVTHQEVRWGEIWSELCPA